MISRVKQTDVEVEMEPGSVREADDARLILPILGFLTLVSTACSAQDAAAQIVARLGGSHGTTGFTGRSCWPRAPLTGHGGTKLRARMGRLSAVGLRALQPRLPTL